MKEIVVNNINQQLRVHAHQTGELPENLVKTIENDLFRDRPKYFNRLLANTSQPTLEEAASIADFLNSSIDDLFVFGNKESRKEEVLP